jgi:hypothetical protein
VVRYLPKAMPSRSTTATGGPVSPQAQRAALIAQWEQHRARGRTDFVLRRGVLGYGVPAALLAVAYRVVQEQGFVLPHLTDSLRGAIAVALVVFPLCGGLFGRWLWNTGEARYHSLVRDRDRAST